MLETNGTASVVVMDCHVLHVYSQKSSRRLLMLLREEESSECCLWGLQWFGDFQFCIAGICTEELTNGCLCCSVKDDLRKAVMTVLERKDTVDYLVIETSGAADPRPVAASLQQVRACVSMYVRTRISACM